MPGKSASYLLLILVMAFGCAKRGNISGGSKDTLAPVLRTSFPENFSTGFKGDEIRLVFDEYVKLKNVNKQLIVSPPMDLPPDISPLTASRTITIKFRDTLENNTTYSLNFGQSIEDNNESNPYPQFKYVFSTGSYIDSLTLAGTVKDSYAKTVEPFVSVMLYDAETFTDSLIYKQNPRYITNTLDSLTSYRFENLKEGRYVLVAMKDYNSNNKFDPKTDKVGFQFQPVSVPNDTLFEIELFQEEVPFRAVRPTQVSGGKLLLGYEGNPDGLTADVFSSGERLESIITKVPRKDSVNIWHKPVKADSLLVKLNKGTYSEEYAIRVKDQKRDSLNLAAQQAGVLPLRDKLTLISNNPLVSVNNALIKLIDKDSADVAFETEYDPYLMRLQIDFQKEPLEKYMLELFPGALTDIFDQTNDSLRFTMPTKNVSDYGNLRIVLENVNRFPIIVELTNAKGDIMSSKVSDSATTFDFNLIDPALYTLRIIYDDNKNGVWDTGNFLQRRQSEEVIYFPKEIDVRANWDVDQPFTLP